jgi:hypothetical protein
MRKLLITLFIIVPSLVLAQNGTKDGEFNIPEVDQLYIVIDAGMKINITGTDTDKITYNYELEGNSEAYEHYFQNFDPKFESRSGRASLMIDFPQNKSRNVNFKIKKHNLTLSVPKNIELQLQTRYSNVEVKSINRITQVTNRSGSVYIHDIGQGIVVDNEYGNIRTEEINGDVRLSSRSSGIDAKNIRGSLTVKSNYTKMNLTKISGELNIENKSGTINAYDLDSKITARGDYVNYELTDLRGDVDIDTKSGSISIDKAENVNITGDYTNVTATNIKGGNGITVRTKSSRVVIKNVMNGDANVNGEYINIELEKIARNVQIRNKSGKINTNGIGGDILIDGDYNGIQLRNYLGDYIQVQNRSGDIEIEVMKRLKNLQIITSYGDVDIDLRSPFEGSVYFDLEYGKLSQPFKLNNSTFNTSTNSTKVQGTVGTGNGSMSIQARNADITINQD